MLQLVLGFGFWVVLGDDLLIGCCGDILLVLSCLMCLAFE